MSFILTGKNLTTEVSEKVYAESTHDILCFCLPTIEPFTMRKLLLPTFQKLSLISKYVTVAINFQPPYTEHEALEVITELRKSGFEVKAVFNEYLHKKGAVPFNRIRNDCVALAPNAKLYALLDDDMTFEDGICQTIAEQYLAAIHYMLLYPKCGAFVFDGDKPFSDNIAICPMPSERAFITGKGLIFKSLDGKLFPMDGINLVGAGEENVLGFSRLANGMFVAGLNGARCRHYENQRGEVLGGGLQFGWAAGEVLSRPDSCVRWMESHGKNPNGFFDKNLYFAAGGLATEIKEARERYTLKITELYETECLIQNLLSLKKEIKENGDGN